MTSPRHRQSITKTRRRHHHDTTETTPRGHRNIIATSPRHQQSITKTKPRHHRDTPRHHPSNTKPRPTHHGDFTETCPRCHQHITERSPKHHQKTNKTTPKQHRDITKKRQRQDRDMTESINVSILKHHPSTYGPQLHWFAQRCTIYKFKLEFEILLRKPIKMFITKKSKHHQQSKKTALQHQRTTPSHNPLIIKTSQHDHNTSWRLHRYMPERSPTHH